MEDPRGLIVLGWVRLPGFCLGGEARVPPAQGVYCAL